MRLLGFLFGVITVAILTLWYYGTRLNDAEQQQLQQEIGALITTATDLAETAKATSVPAGAELEKTHQLPTTPTATSEPTVSTLPTAVTVDGRDIESGEATTIADAITPAITDHTPQLAAVWPPFGNESRAMGFANYLSKKSGETLTVVAQHDQYHVALLYHSVHELALSLANIRQYAEAAAAKPLEY